MKSAVIVFPGSNCDRDVATALARVTGCPPRMIWHKETDLPEVDLVVVPGGFSFGDYLRAGAIAAHSPIMREVKRMASAGVAVLGICNGFQVLTEALLLPGALLRNAGLRFVCCDVFLKVETTNSIFSAGYSVGEVVRIPIAHNDGNYFADDDTVSNLLDEDRVAFRYCAADGTIAKAANPNGSLHNIAGILNKQRNVLGMMPHPERAADPLLDGTDGTGMFRSLLATFH